MKMLLALSLAAGSLFASAPAHAQDTRPCVSKVEYQSARGIFQPGVPPLTKRQIERRWDVVGLGQLDPDNSDTVTDLYVYRACGYPESVAQVWATYNAINHKFTGLYRDGASHAIPNGRP